MLTFEDMIDRYEELILEAWLSGSPRKL